MLDTTTDLRSLLKDPELLATKAYVAGEWVDATDGATFEVTNPARGDVIAKVASLGRRRRRRPSRRRPRRRRPGRSAPRRTGPVSCGAGTS
jgi:hypothetical protein